MKGADLFPDLTVSRANWLALAVFGREQYAGMSGHWVDGVELSARSYVLLYADAGLLITMFDESV